MKPGDLVISKQGRSVILGVGEVISEYRYEDGRSEYRSVRDVRWQHVGSWALPDEHQMVAKTLTDMTSYPAWVEAASNAIRGEEPGKRELPGAVGGTPYGVEDALSEVFLTQSEFTHIVDALGRRKNVILEGAPGVGKTYVAKRIAWSLMGEKDDSRVQMVQFHQSYAYEDFVQGWRPQAQGFSLQNGVFYRFCERARLDPSRKYVFIIDEINRGNLSKIFGELFMLIESDKRDVKYAVPLVYSPEETFYVPNNVYLLGMMNTADRSLAMVDYALRRRFSFNRISPAFMSEGFSNYLTNAGATDDLIKKIQDRMGELNQVIAGDSRNLGPGYQIGHSFFVPEDGAGNLDEDWYRGVVNEEIAPLLREYWFGREDQVQEHVERLLS
jgi:DNA polymerase III delta prime subunit